MLSNRKIVICNYSIPLRLELETEIEIQVAVEAEGLAWQPHIAQSCSSEREAVRLHCIHVSALTFAVMEVMEVRRS